MRYLHLNQPQRFFCLAMTLAACSLFWSCSAAPPPTPPPPQPPPPPIPSLDELSDQYLSRIDENRRTVDDYEARKDEIVARKLEDLKRQRSLRQVQLSEADTKRQKITLWNEQLTDRKTQLAAGADQGAMRQDMERQIADLERQIAEETAELNLLTNKAQLSEKEIQRLEKAQPDGLFLDEMQPLYREGVELHLGFYRGVIDLAQDQLTPGEEASALVDHFTERMSERDNLLGRELKPDAFATLSHEFELDRRMSQAWLSALILEVRFSLGAFQFDSIPAEERGELQLLAESLRESWGQNENLVMYIDGHADSRQFRGQTACVSATKNRQLSRLRAETVRDFFAEQLGGQDDQIQVDWFGNFSPRQTSDLGDRRIELRISARRADGSFDSHRDYFAMRQGLELNGRTFRRLQGAWVESGCEDPDTDSREVEYLSNAYQELASRLGFLDSSTQTRLDANERHLEVFLGNAFTVADSENVDGKSCVVVRPCPEPIP